MPAVTCGTAVEVDLGLGGGLGIEDHGLVGPGWGRRGRLGRCVRGRRLPWVRAAVAAVDVCRDGRWSRRGGRRWRVLGGRWHRSAKAGRRTQKTGQSPHGIPQFLVQHQKRASAGRVPGAGGPRSPHEQVCLRRPRRRPRGGDRDARKPQALAPSCSASSAWRWRSPAALLGLGSPLPSSRLGRCGSASSTTRPTRSPGQGRRAVCRSRPWPRPPAAPGLPLEWQEIPAGPDEALAGGRIDLWPTHHRPARAPSGSSTSARPGWRASTCSCCARDGPLPGPELADAVGITAVGLARATARRAVPEGQRRRLSRGPRRRSRTCARATWPPAFLESRLALAVLRDRPPECASVVAAGPAAAWQPPAGRRRVVRGGRRGGPHPAGDRGHGPGRHARGGVRPALLLRPERHARHLRPARGAGAQPRPAVGDRRPRGGARADALARLVAAPRAPGHGAGAHAARERGRRSSRSATPSSSASPTRCPTTCAAPSSR